MSRLVVQLLQFLVGLLLARLLSPSDFGAIASVYVISGFAVLFFELGLGAALVQRVRPTEKEMSTVFWINALGGLIFVGVLAAAGPAVAAFYGIPQLVWLTPLVGLSFTLSFGVVHNALLQKQLKLRTVAMIEVSSAAIGHITTVVAAFLGAGVASLAYGPIVTSLLGSVLSVACVPWRPRHFISVPALRELWRFSGGLLGFNAINYWGRNVDNMAIGRLEGAAQLGYYNRAYNLMLLPITQVTGALSRVMFPAMAAMQGDIPRTRSAYLRALRVINAITIPAVVGMAVVAPGLVPLLWGDQWLPSVPLLQVLCLAGVPQCLSTSVGWIYQSQGRTDVMFKMGLVGTAVGVTAIFVGLQWGALGVAWGVLARYWIMMPVGLAVAGRLIDLRLSQVARGAASTALATASMAAAAYGLPLVLRAQVDQASVVLAQAVTGAVVYAAVLWLTDRALVLDVARAVGRRRGARRAGDEAARAR